MIRHETAQQRYRRQRRDPYRAAQIAPSYDVPPVKCLCSHARLMHDDAGRCLSRACGCAQYREDTRGSADG